MGNTPNNNFPYPESTDLVKDGAQAIEDLAASIDTKLGVYSTPGMVKLASVAFSAVASQSVNDVFSATYKNYKIAINFDKSVNTGGPTIRLRTSGTDNTTSNYFSLNNFTQVNGGVAGTNKSSAGSSFLLYDGADANLIVHILKPQLSSQTYVSSPRSGYQYQAAGYFTADFAGLFNASTSFDGFTIIVPSGTMTGSVSVYGYSN
jgi:hypothetical protein